MSAAADLLAAVALVLVIEGIAAALLAPKLPEVLDQMRALDPERARWLGLVLAVLGTGLYVLIRG